MRSKYIAIPMSLCVTAALSLGLPARALAASPEFARTQEEWARLRDNVLEYEEIEDLVHEYNTTVLNNRRIWWMILCGRPMISGKPPGRRKMT